MRTSVKNSISVLLTCLVFIPAMSEASKPKEQRAPHPTNIIMMIPDGTSISVLSLARWYKYYVTNRVNFGKDKTEVKLEIDDLLCGMVKTHSSNAPIGDSAPTSSRYATGQASQTGYIAMYPPRDFNKEKKTDNDLVNLRDSMAFQPMMTVLEAARLKGMKTGLVFTCEFPHATPADFSSHYYYRERKDVVKKQMVHNGLDLVIGGGIKHLLNSNDSSAYQALKWQNDTIFLNSPINAVRDIPGRRIWALYDSIHMSYDWNRTGNEPSLAEMTSRALEILSKANNQGNGFLLMIEGSQVDFAAHENDVTGMLSEILAFDDAVGEAVKFAGNDSNTVVIICPDHGNSGFSIGNRKTNEGNTKYDKLTLDKLMEPFANLAPGRNRLTPTGIAELKRNETFADVSELRCALKTYLPASFLQTVDLEPIVKELLLLNPRTDIYRDTLKNSIIRLISGHSCFGFTTHGHTGEDVFLAVFNPVKGLKTPGGLVNGTTIHNFICEAMHIPLKEASLPLMDSTLKYFSAFLPDKCKNPVRIDSLVFLTPDQQKMKFQKGDIVLQVIKNDRTYLVPAYKNFYVIKHPGGDSTIRLKSVTVYVNKANKGKGAFYLPKDLSDALNK